MQEQRVMCPILKKQINDTVCYDVHMNVEGLAPDWTIPEEILQVPEYQKICMKCKNHRE